MTIETAPRRNGSPAARILIVLLLLFLAVCAVLWYSGALTPRPRIVLVTAGSAGNFWEMIVRGAEDAAHRYNVKLEVLRPGPDEPSQSAAIQSLLGQDIDGVAVSPNDPPRQAALLADLGSNTNLIMFDSDTPVSTRLCFIGTDNYDAGRTCGQQIRQAIPDGGEVILAIGSLEKENGQRRRQGVIDELLERTFEPMRPMDPVEGVIADEKKSKYTIVATLVDGIDANKATTMAAEALSKYPNVKCFVGLFAYNTPAILKALADADKLGQVKVVGFDANEGVLEAIEAGHVYATVMQDAYGIGFQTVRTLADVARGDKRNLPMFQTFFLSADPVTKANVAAVKFELEQKRTRRTAAASAPAVPLPPPVTETPAPTAPPQPDAN